jgi:hypothetical protein
MYDTREGQPTNQDEVTRLVCCHGRAEAIVTLPCYLCLTLMTPCIDEIFRKRAVEIFPPVFGGQLPYPLRPNDAKVILVCDWIRVCDWSPTW